MGKLSDEIFTVMFEPVKSCNISCRHCYSNIKHGGLMSGEVLNLALEKIISYTKQTGFKEIHFIWHGGEPLLAGIDFFKQAMETVNRLFSAVCCRHFIQTNGLLLNDEFCSFFRDMNFEVGVSLDGPPDIHDKLRVAVEGTGTHKEVLNKVSLLEKHGVPPGFCAVVSGLSKGHEERIYQFFKKLGYGFRVNPLIPPRDYNESREFLLKEGEYGKFLCRLFDVWTRTETGRIKVSPLDSYLRAILTGEPTECQHQASCVGSHIGIRPGGDAVLCSRYEKYILGNIREMSINDIFASPLCNEIKRRANDLVKCRSCENRCICHGGCPHNTVVFHHNIMDRDPFCKDYRIIFNHIRSAVKQYSNVGVN